MVSLAQVVQIRLEVVIDNLAVRLCEAVLLLVVAVAKVVALAAGQEIVAARLVGRFGAAVAGPDQIGRGFSRPGGLELVHWGVQEEIVGRAHAAGIAIAAEDVGN